MTEHLHTRKGLIERLQALGHEFGTDVVSRSTWLRETGISEWHITKHFESWNDFVSAAGLQPTDVSRIDDDELFRAMGETFRREDGICTRTRFRKVNRYSDYVYSKRWGRWDKVLEAFRSWITENDCPDFPYLTELDPAPRTTPEPTKQASSAARSPWISLGGTRYGPFLNFRGLLHAPVNEQGVVLLFGMVAFELGYVVEAIRADYPDCEAKRRLADGSWERVRIEFEYLSRNFLAHGHDEDECDLIVCWVDDWPECPVETLELQTVIRELEQ